MANQTVLRPLRAVAQKVLDLDPAAPDFGLRLQILKDHAASALQEAKHIRPGNPRIGQAQAVAARKRFELAEQRRNEILPVLSALRNDGSVTYAQLARRMNEMGIKPLRSDKWTGASVHALEHRPPKRPE